MKKFMIFIIIMLLSASVLPQVCYADNIPEDVLTKAQTVMNTSFRSHYMPGQSEQNIDLDNLKLGPGHECYNFNSTKILSLQDSQINDINTILSTDKTYLFQIYSGSTPIGGLIVDYGNDGELYATETGAKNFDSDIKEAQDFAKSQLNLSNSDNMINIYSPGYHMLTVAVKKGDSSYIVKPKNWAYDTDKSEKVKDLKEFNSTIKNLIKSNNNEGLAAGGFSDVGDRGSFYSHLIIYAVIVFLLLVLATLLIIKKRKKLN